MGLRELTVTQQVGLLFVILFGLLALATLLAFASSLRDANPRQQALRDRFARDLRAIWIGAVIFWVSWAAGPVVSTLLFGLVSFLALREFVTLTHTRRGDHRSLWPTTRCAFSSAPRRSSGGSPSASTA
jgi:phosphatidate cytidylyltransferase